LNRKYQKQIKGRQTIDATSHLVAAGFVDIHAHGQNNDLVADADKNFVQIMKGGKIYKNTISKKYYIKRSKGCINR